LKKSVDLQPIFFDKTGRRKMFFNIFLPVFTSILIFFSLFVFVYSRKVNQITNNLTPTVERVTSNSNVSVVFTENHPLAYSVIKDRIESTDSIFIPRYLVKDKKVTTPDEYLTLFDEITFVEKDWLGEHTNIAIMSGINFSIPPTERNIPIQSTDITGSSYVESVTIAEVLRIRNDLEVNNFDEIFIDLDTTKIKSSNELVRVERWFEDTKLILEESGIKVGILISPTYLNDYSASIIKKVDRIYFKIDKQNTNLAQLNLLLKYSNIQPKNVYLEVPTISTQKDISVKEGYLGSVDYYGTSQYLDMVKIDSRGIEPVKTINGKIQYYSTDAITTYNYLRYLRNGSFFIENTNYKFSISDPGFEEFTTWSLIEDPFNAIRNSNLLSKNYRASLNIETTGVGEVYSIDNKAESGNRDIQLDDQLFVIQSQIISQDKPALVEKSGHVNKTIALTFDDGPHPETTEKVLDILDSYGVKGTFFVIGKNVLAYPDVTKAIIDRGHEIENHSHTHPVFSQIDQEAQIQEILASNAAIESITGIIPKYFRKPYSNLSNIDTDQSVEYLSYLKTLNLSASEYDIDSKDWLVDSPEESVQKVIEEIEISQGNFSQILFHDTSERVDNTLIALPRIIEYLQENDIEIVRVDELDTNAEVRTNIKPETTIFYRAIYSKQKVFNFIFMFNIFALLISILRSTWLIIGTFIYKVNMVLKLSFFSHINQKQRRYPPLAVIIACHNEELVIKKTIDSLIACNYPKLQIVVVNDGSTDRTAEIVEEMSKIYTNIKLINSMKMGKAKALQRSIKEVRTKWIVFCDADTIFEKKALHNFSNNILIADENIGAIAGNILVGNQRNLITLSQTIEYGISQQFIKPAQDVINTITVVPGAVGMWRRDALIKSGGFLHDTLAEDADATMRIISIGKKVRFNSEARAKTEVPENFKDLFRQRTRWQLGNMQALYKHKKGVFNPHYSTLGFVGLPLFYIDIAMNVMYPLLSLFTLYIFISTYYNLQLPMFASIPYLDQYILNVLALLFIILELALSIYVIIFQKHGFFNKLKLFLTLPFFLIVYKFFLSYATCISAIRALKGTHHGWNYLNRTANVALEI